MFPKINPTETDAWQQLKLHYARNEECEHEQMFREDTDRSKNFPRLSMISFLIIPKTGSMKKRSNCY